MVMAAGCGQVKSEKVETDNALTAKEVKEDTKDKKEEAKNIIKEKEESVKQDAKNEDAKTSSKEDSSEVKEAFIADRTKAFELLSNINVGWNLGNTMDARGVGNSLSAETAWSNPKTSQEMIDCVADAGFNAIRIPVTWAEHMGPGPDYIVDEAWMKRVKEIVDYAVKNDMYIMLNTHHEEHDWLIVKEENQEALCEQLSALWKQIAEEFKDYDEKVIFEGMNEPRCLGSEKEWSGGTPEERAVVNALNKTFVDTVRSTGGNNENRLLVICTYGNNPGNKALTELEIPDDNNIAVAIHMYTPYEFTYYPDNGNGIDVRDGSMKAGIVNTVKQLDQYFIQKGIPVVITEFGAQNKGNRTEIIKWVKDYLATMDRYGIKCFWWDNGLYPDDGKYGNENFALFCREELRWYEPEIVEAIVNREKQ